MAEPLAMRVTVRLRPDPRVVAVARRFISETCVAAGIDAEVCQTAALLVSELVSNAVVHAGTDIVLDVQPDAHVLHIEVTDHLQVPPLQPSAGALDDENGRGLKLVDLLASAWGHAAAPSGKTPWFDLSLTS